MFDFVCIRLVLNILTCAMIDNNAVIEIMNNCDYQLRLYIALFMFYVSGYRSTGTEAMQQCGWCSSTAVPYHREP